MIKLRRLGAALAAAVLVNSGLVLLQLATAPAEAAWTAPSVRALHRWQRTSRGLPVGRRSTTR